MEHSPEIDFGLRDEFKRSECGVEQELATSTCSNWSDEGDLSIQKESQSALIALEGEESTVESSPPPSLEQPMDGKKYEEILWVELTSNVQEAAIRLGYTEEIWDENKEPDASKKYWEELGCEEKEAAKVLGYDEVHWNFGSKDVTPEDYEDMYWNQLPRHIRKAYKVLGYSKQVWNEDDAPASFDKDWHELTEAEQRAATIVGYTEETWDDDPEDKLHGNIKGESIIFIRGACYILLECISMAAFSGCIKMVFSVGKQLLSDRALNAFKIVVGLAIMQCNGQIHKWLVGEEENMTRGKKEEPTLFRSFVNLFSWWTIFAGVEHFVGAFENDVLYSYTDTQLYYKLCELEDNVTNATLTNATATDNMTCSIFEEPVKHTVKYMYMLEDYLVDNACAFLDDEREAMGPVYYFTLFFGSAVSMWYVFQDNFLQGCDTD